MRQTTENIHQRLNSLVGDSLTGIAYYSPEESNLIYLRDDLRERYDSETVMDLLRDAVLESIGADIYEEYHGQKLRATARLFDDIVVVTIITSEQGGIMFGLDWDGEYHVREVVDEALSVASEDFENVEPISAE